MKALKIIFGLSLLFALSTCTKFGKNVTVKGRVLNPITGEGIAGEEVWLMRSTPFLLPKMYLIYVKKTSLWKPIKMRCIDSNTMSRLFIE